MLIDKELLDRLVAIEKRLGLLDGLVAMEKRISRLEKKEKAEENLEILSEKEFARMQFDQQVLNDLGTGWRQY